jgi:hypothetical protein
MRIFERFFLERAWPVTQPDEDVMGNGVGGVGGVVGTAKTATCSLGSGFRVKSVGFRV